MGAGLCSAASGPQAQAVEPDQYNTRVFYHSGLLASCLLRAGSWQFQASGKGHIQGTVGCPVSAGPPTMTARPCCALQPSGHWLFMVAESRAWVRHSHISLLFPSFLKGLWVALEGAISGHSPPTGMDTESLGDFTQTARTGPGHNLGCRPTVSQSLRHGDRQGQQPGSNVPALAEPSLAHSGNEKGTGLCPAPLSVPRGFSVRPKDGKAPQGPVQVTSWSGEAH